MLPLFIDFIYSDPLLGHLILPIDSLIISTSNVINQDQQIIAENGDGN